MRDSLDVKLEQIQRDFLISEFEQYGWNINSVLERYSISRQELMSALGEKVFARGSHNQYKKTTTTI